MTTGSTPPTVNCLDQVRVWISSEGLPVKHQARLARLRAMDPAATIMLIVSYRWLEPAAAEALATFAARLDIELHDIAAIPAADDDEATILEHVHAEVDAHFTGPEQARGNLSVVSDQVRLLDFVLRRGLCTDMDIEFEHPVGVQAAVTPCPLGVIARHKANGCVGNDVTAGDPQGSAFRIARRNVAHLIRAYRQAAARHLAAAHPDGAAIDEVWRHPRFFELRGLHQPDPLTGTERFSLTAGPDNFAVALHQAGITTGYEQGVVRGAEPGELTPDHVPHVIEPGAAEDGRLAFRPFAFEAAAAVKVRARHRRQLWPASLPAVTCHWDHSWIPGHDAWRAVTFRERLLVDLAAGPGWSVSDAIDLLRPDTVVRCTNRVVPTLPAREAAGRDARSYSVVTVGGSARPAIVEQLAVEGALCVRSLISDSLLSRLRGAFELEVQRKRGPTSLEQVSFNLAVDGCTQDTVELVRELAHLPDLTSIVAGYFGGRSRFVSARGYRQGPHPPVRYRAWDFHQDMKTRGPVEELKVMVLLTDVPAEGQAMRFACGSHLHRWRFRTQRETRFSLDEALELGGRGLFRGHGPAGTCVLFDTNGIHSGHRNLSATRDVITLNFVADSPEAFHMFSDPALTAPAVMDPPLATPEGDLTWDTPILDETELQALAISYRDTPELAAVSMHWNGDAVDLVDLVIDDLNADLDLRISHRFEDDRLRDIGIVRLRDAAPDDEQYCEIVARVGGWATGLRPLADRSPGIQHGGAWHSGSCPIGDDPVAGAVNDLQQVARALADRAEADAPTCLAVVEDLIEAVPRCEDLARLRTTTAYACVAAAWAQRLLVGADAPTVEEGCGRLLHLYTHLVEEPLLADPIQGTYLHG